MESPCNYINQLSQNPWVDNICSHQFVGVEILQWFIHQLFYHWWWICFYKDERLHFLMLGEEWHCQQRHHFLLEEYPSDSTYTCVYLFFLPLVYVFMILVSLRMMDVWTGFAAVQGSVEKIRRSVQNLNYYTLVFGLKWQNCVLQKLCQYVDTLGMPTFFSLLYLSLRQGREVMLELCQWCYIFQRFLQSDNALLIRYAGFTIALCVAVTKSHQKHTKMNFSVLWFLDYLAFNILIKDVRMCWRGHQWTLPMFQDAYPGCRNHIILVTYIILCP